MNTICMMLNFLTENCVRNIERRQELYVHIRIISKKKEWLVNLKKLPFRRTTNTINLLYKLYSPDIFSTSCIQIVSTRKKNNPKTHNWLIVYLMKNYLILTHRNLNKKNCRQWGAKQTMMLPSTNIQALSWMLSSDNLAQKFVSSLFITFE